MLKMLDNASGIIAIPEKELATLTITGRGTNSYGHTTVYCKFNLKNWENPTSSEVERPLKKECEKQEIKFVEKQYLLPYREYNNLSTLSIDSTHKVSAIGYAKSYGGERLVIKIGDTFYQAGEDLENKIDIFSFNIHCSLTEIKDSPRQQGYFSK